MLSASLPEESLSWDYGVRRSLIERTLKRVGGRAEVLNCVIASRSSIDRGSFSCDNQCSRIAPNQVECLGAEGILATNAHSFLAPPRRPAVVISESSTAAGCPTAIPCSRTTCHWEINLVRESRNQGHECSCDAVQCFPRSNASLRDEWGRIAVTPLLGFGSDQEGQGVKLLPAGALHEPHPRDECYIPLQNPGS